MLDSQLLPTAPPAATRHTEKATKTTVKELHILSLKQKRETRLGNNQSWPRRNPKGGVIKGI